MGTDKKGNSRKVWIRISPWVIMGSLVVMAPIFIFITMESIRIQRRSIELMLSEKGGALIRAFEAGTRTGMMWGDWSGSRVQQLIRETADLPDILYILITDEKGTIIAHNQPLNIGLKYGPDLPKVIDRTLRWRIVMTPNGTRVFEVYRRFHPSRPGMFPRPGHPMHYRYQDWFSPHMLPAPSAPPVQVIYVGLDMEPIERVVNESIKQKVILAVFLLMYGLLGIVAVVIVQNYLSTRASLSRVRAFSDTLVENMPMGLVVIGETGTLLSLNDVSERLLGISGRDWADSKAKDILPREIVDMIAEVDDEHPLATKELELDAGGRNLSLEATAGSLRDEEGRLLGHLVLLRDVTEIEHLKREMERKERLASLGSLAAGVAHEIRNPLSSIKGFATYFRERYHMVPEDARIADIMIGEVERLNRVIGQLLDLAKPLDMKKERCSLLSIVRRTLETVEDQAARRSITIDRSGLGENPCHVVADPDKIAQVMLNLYLNAMEAMDSGGVLSVALECNGIDSPVTIEVSDTGCGIHPEHLEHIFDPYFTTKQSGTGLGLAVVHKIVEAHGGDIKVTSRMGQGTTVRVTLGP